MLRKTIITVLGLFLLSGCTDGFRGYFKKSANNKIIDTKGFEGSKRQPLYNKKYISMAKRNVTEENFDDDEEDLLSEADTETINPTLRNRQMYLKMVKQDADRKRRQKLNQDKDYPSLNLASDRVKKRNSDEENSKLHKELEQIKAMLHETKKDLEKYSCPAGKNVKTQSADMLPIETDSHKNSKKLETNKTQSVVNKSEMKRKFLSEDYDDIKVNDPNGKVGKNDTNNRVNSTIVNEQEKFQLPPRAI